MAAKFSKFLQGWNLLVKVLNIVTLYTFQKFQVKFLKVRLPYTFPLSKPFATSLILGMILKKKRKNKKM